MHPKKAKAHDAASAFACPEPDTIARRIWKAYHYFRLYRRLSLPSLPASTSLFSLLAQDWLATVQLVSHAAGGLASGLAGCLAFAAAAVGQRVLQAGLLDGFDMLHSCNPPFLKKGYMGIIHDSGSNCNHFPEIFDTIAPIIPPVAVPIARSAKYAVHGAP